MIGLLSICLMGYALQDTPDTVRSLPYYIEAAQEHSPLIHDLGRQAELQQDELQRLRAAYTRSKVELNGDFLFVPILSRDNGHTSFQWNAQDATDYYGYDLGVSSGHLHAGVTWTQPLLGKLTYRSAKEQAQISTAIADNRIGMERHQLERSVTEQYLLCLLDQEQKSFAASLALLLGRQMTVVKNLAAHGLGRITDLRLLAIEMEADSVLQNTYRQDYRTHLSELNILCGISDTTEVRLSPVILQMKTSSGTSSAFMEQYRLDSLNAWASLHAFNQQYHPRLDLFIDGGLQISQYNQMYRHFGWSAGLTFAWTLFDGKQKRWKERQTLTQISTIEDYKNNFLLQQSQRKRQYLSEIKSYETRKILMDRQLAEYDFLLADYRKEMRDGQVSVIDYISVLRNKIQTEKDRMLLDTNRQLLLVAFNYWNW